MGAEEAGWQGNNLKSNHLIIPEPNAAIHACEAEDMIEEGLAALMALGCCEGVREHFLQQLKVGFLIEGLQRSVPGAVGGMLHNWSPKQPGGSHSKCCPE